jgi:hypothetical protein
MTSKNIQKREHYVKIPMKSKLMVLNQIVFGNVPIKQVIQIFYVRVPKNLTLSTRQRKHSSGSIEKTN